MAASRLILLFHLIVAPAMLVAQQPDKSVTDVSQRALEIHHSGMLFDGHNDLPWQMKIQGQSSFDFLDISKPQPTLHTDIARLRAGGVKAQFWSVYVSADTATTGDSLLQTMEQIDVVHRMVRRYPETFELADTADDIERIAKAGKIASMLGIEGGYSIQESLPILRRLYGQGCRYMTLTHSKSLSWADSATDEPRTRNGLSPFGEEVIREMNRLGMLVDLSHVSVATMKRSLEISKAPVIFSHSSSRAINDHPRNVNDAVLRLTAKNGGVVMVNFYSGFVTPTEQLKKNDKALGTLSDVVDHIEHIIKVAGIDHVGIGADFDGVGQLPVGLEDVSTYPRITQELLNRGHKRDAIHKLLGGNVMRVLRAAEKVAASLKAS
ncbi:MAG: membrane dipeptidase [Planctomycetaceae bacterium]|jgi:membrane dipeptidase